MSIFKLYYDKTLKKIIILQLSRLKLREGIVAGMHQFLTEMEQPVLEIHFKVFS
jgi:hypothetical protein